MPNNKYKVVQTGPKIQFGGLNDGLFRDEYHSGIAWDVNIPAIAPMANGKASDITNFTTFNDFINQIDRFSLQTLIKG
jgi:hypothetical protein